MLRGPVLKVVYATAAIAAFRALQFHGRKSDICEEVRSGNPSKDIGQLGLRVEVVHLGGDDQRISRRNSSHTTWHDLVLYFIVRFAGPTAAIEIARFFALRCHDNGQALYAVFAPPSDHDDAMVREAQHWLQPNFASRHPVEGIVAQRGCAARTFKRRFRAATGHAPMNSVQRLRVEAAKRQLKRTDTAVDEIAADVGHHDPAFSGVRSSG